MNSSKNYLLVVLSIVVLFFLCFATSSADVVYKEKSTVFGVMGMPDMDTETTIMLKGDKQKQDAVMKFTGSTPMGMPGMEDRKQLTITRLDKGLIWNIDTEKRTYTEMTLEQVKMMMDRVMVQKEKVKQEELETKFKIDVKKVDQKREIGGYQCEEFIIEMITEGRDPRTGEPQEVEIQTRLWVSTEVEGSDQIESFHRKMAEKMGLEGEYGSGITQALSRFGIEAEELGKKMDEIKGFPMRTELRLKALGEGITEAEQEEKAEQMKAMEEAMKMLGKKMRKTEETKEDFLFMMLTEVTDIQIKGTDNSEFELPKHLKKQQ